MALVTFSSPLLKKDVTVYAIAGDCGTILSIAESNHIPLPFECRDGNCGSCLIEVEHLSGKAMGEALTEKEKSLLKSLGKLSAADLERAEVSDLSPRHRLACQYIVRDEEIRVTFTGMPGGA
ncbi:MAG: 2Fe-2S iron-sulfur cluster-binding protein [Pseudomonadota bacterium]